MHSLFSVFSYCSATAAELSVVVCHPSNVGTLLEGHSTYPVLRHVVTWGAPQPEQVLIAAEESGVTLLTVEEVEVSGWGQVATLRCNRCEGSLQVHVGVWLLLFGANPHNAH